MSSGGKASSDLLLSSEDRVRKSLGHESGLSNWNTDVCMLIPQMRKMELNMHQWRLMTYIGLLRAPNHEDIVIGINNAGMKRDSISKECTESASSPVH